MKPIAISVAALLLAAAGVRAADHRDSPMTKANAAADITDLYAFVKGSKLIVALDVNPFLAPGARLFDPKVRYSIFIDTDGNASPDRSLEVRFNRFGEVRTSGNLRSQVTRMFTGRREDPFFFDFDLLSNGPVGQDTFAGADVAAIVIEFRLAGVTPHGPAIGIWASTQKQGVGTIDRMGRPAINTIFIPAELKDTFNKARPIQDKDRFKQYISLDILTPDILTIDTSKPTHYPNGRALEDDVIDISLGLLGGGTDKVDGNDAAYLDEFPYLAPPHATSAKPAAAEAAAARPFGFALEPAYPNPFNPSTEIPYALPVEGAVTLKIYSLIGQEVRTLVDAIQAPGRYVAAWDGKDEFGRDAASGIYLYRLQVKGSSERDTFTLARQMTLMR